MKRVLTALAATLPFAANAADAISGAVERQPTNWQAIIMFLIFVVFTLGITYWASKRVRSRSDYYTAGGNITGFQNGLAIAGDYMSAASFLGISALVFTSGYDGLIYSLGFLVGWPIILFLIAERLRNLGRYTFADVASYRLKQGPIRILSACGSLVVVALYLIAQMVGAGKLIELLFGLNYHIAVVLVGVLMMMYVLFGGMLATTWVQIIKAVLLLFGASFMAFMVMKHVGFSFNNLFSEAMAVHPKGVDIMKPGGLVKDPISALSLGLGLMFGTAGLPHILMRFFTVSDAREARDGVRFTNSFVANSLSGPSRACMITGKHSCANKFYDNTTCVFDSAQQTFPKLLQKAGYQTALVGKWHLESLPSGFNYWEIVPGQGDYYNPDFITQDNDTVQKHGYITNLITDDAIDWMENKRDESKPFCLLIHHKAIHRNWMADTCNLALYEDKTFPLPDNFFDDYEGRPAAAAQEMSIVKDMDMIYDLKMLRPDKDSRLKSLYQKFLGRMDEGQRAAWDKFYGPVIDDFYKQNLSGKELADWKFQRYMRDYMKTVKSLDDNVGRVLDYLEKKGLLDNTLVVYTSDQGFYMGEHGWFDKRFMYEESMRTPLIMRMPKGFDRRGDITEMVQNIDYAPTFLELAGAPVPADIQGVSLLPLLKGEQPKDWRNALYYHFYEYPAEHMVKRHYGIRTERYKLIHFYNDINWWELYDMQADPTEMHNLYGQKEYEPVVKELKEQMLKLQEQYNDPVRFSLERDKE